MRLSEYKYYFVCQHCKGEAFYMKKIPRPGETIDCRKSINPDGTRAKPGEDIICFSCKQPLYVLFGSLEINFKKRKK